MNSLTALKTIGKPIAGSALKTKMAMKKYLLLFVITVFAAACGGGAADQSNANKESAPVQVEMATAKIVEIPSYFEATGTLASDAESNVAPTISGKIVRVNFDVGSYVTKGDALVELDAGDATIRLSQARAQAEQQRKAVNQAEAGVAQAVANLRQTQARLGVKDGETFDINNFSQVINVNAQLKLAEQELRRYEKLVESGDVSRSAFDQKKAVRDGLIGQLAEARSNAAVSMTAITTAQKGVDVAKTQVANAKAAVTTAETQIAQAQKSVRDNTVYAPISGYVSERNADPGEFISQNQPNAKLATIMRTAVLRLKIDIPEQSIAKVAVGLGVSAQVSAFPDRKFAGIIQRILPSLNPQSRTLTVEAEIENVGGLLKPGQFATVRITQAKPAPAVMIPAKAVRADGDRNIVFVIKDGIATERPVQTGLLENDMIEIKQGVAENEKIAVSNLAKLADGIIVQQ